MVRRDQVARKIEVPKEKYLKVPNKVRFFFSKLFLFNYW